MSAARPWVVTGLTSLLVALPAHAQARAEWADWLIDAGLTTRFDDNLNRASAASETEHDVSFLPWLRAGRALQLAERTRVLASGEVGGEIYARAEDLGAVAGDASLALLHKFGLGDAPWARLSATGGYQAVRDARRSGPRLAVGIATGKRFFPRFDARLEYRFTARWGRDGPRVADAPGVSDDVFDQQAHDVGVEGRFLATQRLVLIGGFDYRGGDFDSNAQDSRFEILARRDVEAVALDEVFGGWVYKVRGNVYSPFLRANLGLGDRTSIDLGYRFQYGEADGLHYENHVVRGALLFRY